MYTRVSIAPSRTGPQSNSTQSASSTKRVESNAVALKTAKQQKNWNKKSCSLPVHCRNIVEHLYLACRFNNLGRLPKYLENRIMALVRPAQLLGDAADEHQTVDPTTDHNIVWPRDRQNMLQLWR